MDEDEGAEQAIQASHRKSLLPDIGWPGPRPPAGRHLRAPRTSRDRITLPKLLVKQHDAGTEAAPSAATDRRHLRKRTAFLTNKAKLAADSGLQSRELARKRRQHPRLRWLRLSAMPAGPEPSVGESPTGIVKHGPPQQHEAASAQEESRPVRRFVDEALTVRQTEIGPDSIFYTGKTIFVDELMLPLCLPQGFDPSLLQEGEAPSAAQEDEGADVKKMPTVRSNARWRAAVFAVSAVAPKDEKEAEPPPLREGPEEARPAMLLRPRVHKPVASGSVATVCLPDAKKPGKHKEAKDRKYHLRQPPMSHALTAKTGGAAHRSRAAKEYIDFESWSLEDDYVQNVFKQTDLRRIQHVNLSDNRITEQSIHALAALGRDTLTGLESLQLARNQLAAPGGLAVARLLEDVGSPLKELDLTGNLVGDQACEQLCKALVKCSKLAGLSLAQNNLGRGGGVGAALGGLVRCMHELTVLDLHWNHFHGSDAAALFEGLYENNVSKGGRLCRLDISWNCLGRRCCNPVAQLANGDPEDALGASAAPWSSLVSAGYADEAEDELEEGEGDLGLEGEGEEEGEEEDLSGAAVQSARAQGQVRGATFHELASTMRLQALQRASCECKLCADCTRMTKALAAVFRDGQTLFHVDISFNQIRARECAILADGLRSNHSLFGLHMVGNEATVDELGFVVPFFPGAEAMREKRQVALNNYAQSISPRLRLDMTPSAIVPGQLASGSSVGAGSPSSRSARSGRRSISKAAKEAAKQAPAVHVAPPEVGLFGGSKANPSLRSVTPMRKSMGLPAAFSPQDLQAEKQWATMRGRVRQPLEFGAAFEDVRRNARCCWICENWVEQVVSYVPGWSGREASLDDAPREVFAFFSVDDYARPLRLERREEAYDAAGFAPELREDQEGEEGRPRGPCLTATGLLVRFVGSRMLPPSSVPLLVVFQVDGRLVTADDLPVQRLMPRPSIVLSPPTSQSSSSSSLPHGAAAASEGEAGGGGGGGGGGEEPRPLGPPVAVAEAAAANVVSSGRSARELFATGKARALLVMEDLSRRGELKVTPRNLIN